MLLAKRALCKFSLSLILNDFVDDKHKVLHSYALTAWQGFPNFRFAPIQLNAFSVGL